MWDNLTLKQKAEVMKLAVQQGISDLDSIRDLYNTSVNTFSVGGPKNNKKKSSSYSPSTSIKKQVTQWEGASMHSPAPDTGKVNRSFDDEAKDFNAVNRSLPGFDALPQASKDALFSYSYNVGVGNYKDRVHPVLKKFLMGQATVEDVQNSMWASKDSDPRMSGLRRRRAAERNLFAEGLGQNGVAYTSDDIPEEITWENYKKRQAAQNMQILNDRMNAINKSFTSTTSAPTMIIPDFSNKPEIKDEDYLIKDTPKQNRGIDILSAIKYITQGPGALLSSVTPTSTSNSLLGFLSPTKFDKGGPKDISNVTLPEITVYQPIQESIPDFRDLAVKAAGYRWTEPREIHKLYAYEDSSPEQLELNMSYADNPIIKNAYKQILDNGYQKFATDWFGNLVPASAITSVMKSIEHNWRMKYDRAYRDKYEAEGAAGEASNLDNFYNSQFDANDIIAQKNKIRQADREAANRTDGLEHALITIPASVIGAAALPYSAIKAFLALSESAQFATGLATILGLGTVGGIASASYDKYNSIKNELNRVNDFLRFPIVQKTLEDAKTNLSKSSGIMSALREGYTLGDIIESSALKHYVDPYNGPLIKEGSYKSFILTDPNGTPQDTYLMNRDSQKEVFLSRGFKEVPGDYGLVRKAVGDRDIPVYQKNPDMITRDQLTPIGNLFTYERQGNSGDRWLGPEGTRLEQPGNYPSALYVDKEGNFYQKAWDLNDYGIDENKLDYLRLGRMGTYLDQIGSPTVVTTGFQKIDKEDLKQYLNEVDWTKEGKKIKEKLEKELKKNN